MEKPQSHICIHIPSFNRLLHCSVVDVDKYRKATSYCRSVQLLGYTVGAVLGQLLVSLDLLSYHGILVLTLVLISIATLTACFLPMPRHSMFFHRQRGPGPGPAPKGSMDNTQEAGTGDLTAREKVGEGEGGGEDDKGSSVRPAGCGQVIRQLWADFLQCYSSRQMLYWSVWWALATAGYNQTVNYVQVCSENKHTHTHLRGSDRGWTHD